MRGVNEKEERKKRKARFSYHELISACCSPRPTVGGARPSGRYRIGAPRGQRVAKQLPRSWSKYLWRRGTLGCSCTPCRLAFYTFFSFQLLPGQDANKHGRVSLPGESDECRHAFANSFCLFCLFFSFPFSCFYFPGTEGRNSILTLTSDHHGAPVMKQGGNFYDMYDVKMRLVNIFQVAASTAGALLALATCVAYVHVFSSRQQHRRGWISSTSFTHKV